MAVLIETENLTKSFGRDVKAVADLNLRVEEHEIFGMLGPNGAGKTTSVKMLTTLLRPSSGTAKVGGFDVVREPDKVRGIIGYLPQQLTADDTLTGYENLQFHAKLYGLPKGNRNKEVRLALDTVGLSAVSREMVAAYSGGMKRRLELASVLISKPRILFLDEPTLGLDPRSRSLIWAFLLRLRDDLGVTLFVTTNYMDEADRLCDRVAIIDAGKVIGEGSPGTLKQSVGGDIVKLRLTKPDRTIGTLLKSHEAVKILTARSSSAVCPSCGAELQPDDSFCDKCKQLVQGDEGVDTIEIVVEGSGEKAIPSILSYLEANGVEVGTVTLQKPNLDDVFLKYTGKTLQREAPVGGPKRMKRRAKLMQAMRL